LFEYMAMEKPILGADLGQIGTVLSGRGVGNSGLSGHEAGPCGLLYKAGDSSAFIEGLKALVDDPALAAKLAAAARQEVLRRYTWDHHVAVILDKMASLGLVDPTPTQPQA
jgi:glycosyltransferase involved in cell wall biosynthesis